MKNPKFDYENEITGAYYEDKYTLVDFLYHASIVVAGIVLALCIADLIFGAETVTNFIADLLGSLMS